MRKPFSIRIFFLIDRRSFDQKYKFSNKNDMVSAWRNFKNNFSRPLFTIIFRPEMLKFHPYSILTGDTRVEFVIFCVLIYIFLCFKKVLMGLKIEYKNACGSFLLHIPILFNYFSADSTLNSSY